jgi:hypothetical protein
MPENDYDQENNESQNINKQTWQDSSGSGDDGGNGEKNKTTPNLAQEPETIPQLSQKDQETLEEKRNDPEFQQGLSKILPSDDGNGNDDAPSNNVNLSSLIQKWQNDNKGDKDDEPKENKTGLPDELKTGMEALSGISLDDVKVHYNSSLPATVNALAYAKGTDIHIGSGQKKHLAHEAWHVVQQKQGRVKATMQMMGGMNINDDDNLEKEADVMGKNASELGDKNNTAQLKNKNLNNSGKVIQRAFIGRIQMNPALQKWLGKPNATDGEELKTRHIDHSHIYFEDDNSPTAVGYGNDGFGVGEDLYPRKNAAIVRSGLDDSIMRQVIADNDFMKEWKEKEVVGLDKYGGVQEKHKGYKLLFHNCQHFAKAVFTEYKRREQQLINTPLPDKKIDTRPRNNAIAPQKATTQFKKDTQVNNQKNLPIQRKAIVKDKEVTDPLSDNKQEDIRADDKVRRFKDNTEFKNFAEEGKIENAGFMNKDAKEDWIRVDEFTVLGEVHGDQKSLDIIKALQTDKWRYEGFSKHSDKRKKNNEDFKNHIESEENKWANDKKIDRELIGDRDHYVEHAVPKYARVIPDFINAIEKKGNIEKYKQYTLDALIYAKAYEGKWSSRNTITAFYKNNAQTVSTAIKELKKDNPDYVSLDKNMLNSLKTTFTTYAKKKLGVDKLNFNELDDDKNTSHKKERGIINDFKYNEPRAPKGLRKQADTDEGQNNDYLRDLSMLETMKKSKSSRDLLFVIGEAHRLKQKNELDKREFSNFRDNDFIEKEKKKNSPFL